MTELAKDQTKNLEVLKRSATTDAQKCEITLRQELLKKQEKATKKQQEIKEKLAACEQQLIANAENRLLKKQKAGDVTPQPTAYGDPPLSGQCDANPCQGLGDGRCVGLPGTGDGAGVGVGVGRGVGLGVGFGVGLGVGGKTGAFVGMGVGVGVGFGVGLTVGHGDG